MLPGTHIAQLTRNTDPESSKTRKASQSHNVSGPNIESPVNNPLAFLPSELKCYLTTTSTQHAIFASLQDSRDRRLRLLIRRFTNQIQYGCKNPDCHVSTCLSYRKKNSINPLRPYSDVAARALAWRLVENLADSGYERNQSGHVTIRKRGSSKASEYSNIPGLCWNEPIVPWYEDPTEARRRRRSLAKTQDTKFGLPQNGYADAVPVSRATRPADEDMLSTNSATANLEASKASRRSQELPLSLDSGLAPSNHMPVGDESTLNSDADTKEAQSKYEPQGQRRVAFAEPLEEPDTQKRPAAKDSASFTQVLHDTNVIKNFDASFDRHHIPQITSMEDVDAREESRLRVSHQQNLASHTPQSQLSDISTFGVLPLSAILWLRSIALHNQDRSPYRDLSITPDHGPYHVFARQSLHYCLSNPSVLLKSAKTWRFVHPQPYKLDEDVLRRTRIGLVPQEETVLASPHTFPLPQPGGIMITFGMLIAITSIPEVLNHLFAALQHAYILPKWLKRTQSKGSQIQESNVIVSIQPHVSSTDGAKTASHSINERFENVFLNNDQVAQMCMLIFIALQLTMALKPQPFNLPTTHSASFRDFGEQYTIARNSGTVFPYSGLRKGWSRDSDTRSKFQAYVGRIDSMDDTVFQRLLDSAMDVISHRLALSGITRANKISNKTKNPKNVVEMFVDEISAAVKIPDKIMYKQTLQKHLIDLLRSVILRCWDRDAIIQKRGPVGGALEVLAAIYRARVDLGIAISEFQWKFVADAFDEIEMPMKWLEFREDNVQTHILAYSFLFEPASLVTYFRAINSLSMRKSHESAELVFSNARKFLCDTPFNVYGVKEVMETIRPKMAKFFVLTIRRSDMLQDALNQLWRRQRQELMRPLKVRLGKDEGEDGLDHGGVQAEFFRLLFAEVLDPDYGMFTIDQRTRMIWFQPGSLEPLYKFEALGILMSLAIYNGVTLPITFPIAFYRRMLGLKVKKLEHIADGWPDLARGLQHLLDWQDGDVGDVIARTYEFSYEAFGASHTIDMTRVGRTETWPPVVPKTAMSKSLITSFKFAPLPNDVSPTSNHTNRGEQEMSPKRNVRPPAGCLNRRISDVKSNRISSPQSELSLDESEAPLVTNENRDQYVADYIYWLTNKSISPQFDAFLTGLHACLDQTALSVFTPDHLKIVVEGHQHIDIEELQATATYDDYKTTDEVIIWFWQVVKNMSPDQHKKLLEFVTASDRVPVNGINSVVFIIQRNGEGDERLPSSSTCYGRLLLPRYTSKVVLTEKLEKAIENSIGFGSL